MATQTSTKLDWITHELEQLKSQGLYNTIRTISSPQGAWLVVDDRRVLNFCSNNYLGLANDPRLVGAAKAAVDQYGVGPGAVRSIAGTFSLHVELERRLAAFKGVEAAINRDYPVMFGTLYIYTLVGLVLNLVSDLTYVAIDPRIDFATRPG